MSQEASTGRPAEGRAGLVARVLGWLRAGYPDGVPQQDYVALLGLLQRNLTATEIERVVRELGAAADAAGADTISEGQIEKHLADTLKGPPTTDDVLRVSARLAAAGWPLGALGGDGGASETNAAPDVAERSSLLGRIVQWLRAGYPAGLPENDFIPLVALLRRRLTDAEVVEVGRGLLESGLLPADRADVGAEILRVTSEMPAEDDIERVRAYLHDHGWPTDFPV